MPPENGIFVVENKYNGQREMVYGVKAQPFCAGYLTHLLMYHWTANGIGWEWVSGSDWKPVMRGVE